MATQKNPLLNLLLLAFALGICFAGLEFFFRTTHWLGARASWARPDALIGWGLAPGRGYFYPHENPSGIYFDVNRFGYRDREWTEEKPDGTFRVAVLGDSYVEALQVDHGKTFLALAEKKLSQAAGRKIEFMNFGRSCFTQSEELLVLTRDILKFKPDLVIVFYYAINDIGDLAPPTALSLMRPFYEELPDGSLKLDTSFNKTRAFKMKTWLNPFKKRSTLISLITERFIIFERVKQAEQTGLLGSDPDAHESLRAYLSLATSTPEPQYVKNYRLSKRLLSEMARTSQAHQARFMLVNIDLPSYLPEVAQKFKSVNPTFDPDFFDQDLAVFAAKEDMLFLGLEEPFRQKAQALGRPLHFKYWDAIGIKGYWEYGAHTGHWNEDGHALVADQLVEKILPLLAPEAAA
ncbi:MAG: hypothetical protein A2Y02_01485 [Omnitrophica bacterium GWA2_52_12]|nr:MAG: hypothetical protein A2Y02_01485 [Omnitrophica bacterium GWA2_52_12]